MPLFEAGSLSWSVCLLGVGVGLTVSHQNDAMERCRMMDSRNLIGLV